ncbi:MAG TPA: S8 family serine peptidase, partial [Anaerolineaceae bacterium]
FNVFQGGAVGMILYNQAPTVTDLETDNHYLPATHIQFADGQKVLAFVSAHPDAMAVLTVGAKVTGTGDVMASFSSRGGLAQTLGVSKPDITAPGVQVLAGASPNHLTPANGGVALGPQGELFQAIAGTSMSSPHIAGAGALLKALHPNWTPGQIKSALMTTAWTQVVKEDGKTPATVFDDGSGRVDLSKAGDPGLTFDVSGVDYAAHGADLWNLNYPSVFLPSMPGIISVTRTAHNTLTTPTTWSLSVQGATGFSVSVPATLSVPAQGDGAFSITIDASNIPFNQSGSAVLYLKETDGAGARNLHIPITFIRKIQVVALDKTCTSPAIGVGAKTTCTITATNNAFAAGTMAITDTLPAQLKVVAGTVQGGTVSPDLKTVSFAGSLTAAAPPDVSLAAGTAHSAYVPIAGIAGTIPLNGFGDEALANFNVDPFTYGGETYSKIGIVSDGYLVVGGGTAADISALNQKLPNGAPPNNVIAPFWTDLNPATGGKVYVNELTDAANNTWIVVDFAAVKEFSSAATV